MPGPPRLRKGGERVSGRTKRGKTEALAIWLVALAGSADRAAAAAIDHVRSADALIRDRKTVETCGYAQVRTGASRIQLSVSVARFLLFGAEGIMTKPATGPTAAVLIAIVSLGRSAVAYQPVTPDLARVYHIFLTGKARMTVKDGWTAPCGGLPSRGASRCSSNSQIRRGAR